MSKPFPPDVIEDLGHADCEVCNEARKGTALPVEITRITILDFGVERDEQYVKIQFEPLVGDSKEVKIVALRKGDTLTTTAPIRGEGAK